ncbi:MAG: PD-(D/E)XK nuclease family protein [Candidatus Eisenbacteria bacterium]
MSDEVDLFGEPVRRDQAKRPWFSPSRLKLFLECPRRYEFQVVQKLPTAPSPHMDLGSNVHAALRDWLRLSPRERSWDRLLEFYRAAWRGNMPAFAGRSREELQEYGERGKVMLRRFAEETPADLAPVAIEKNVHADYGELVVGGRVDRVDALAGGVLKVVDYKTGKFPRSPARAREEDLAAPVYARGTSALFAGAPVVEVEHHYLATGERLSFPVDEAWQVQKDAVVLDLARRVLRAESAGEFPPAPSKLCAWCDFRARCPEGQAFLDAPLGDR